MSDEKLLVIAGPCVLEDWDVTARVAEVLAGLAAELPIDMYFKASFAKDNRTRGDSYRGPGLEQGLDVLARVGREFGLKLTTDIHGPYQAAPAAEVVHLLQIPAFLCRQTPLIEAAAATGRPLHIKRGQSASPTSMADAVDKAGRAPAVYVGERGTFFGYEQLVVDFAAVYEMQWRQLLVIFDATHARSGRDTAVYRHRYHISEYLARCALAAGVDGLFFEVHPQPHHAKSDPKTQIPLSEFSELLRRLVRHWQHFAAAP